MDSVLQQVKATSSNAIIRATAAVRAPSRPLHGTASTMSPTAVAAYPVKTPGRAGAPPPKPQTTNPPTIHDTIDTASTVVHIGDHGRVGRHSARIPDHPAAAQAITQIVSPTVIFMIQRTRTGVAAPPAVVAARSFARFLRRRLLRVRICHVLRPVSSSANGATALIAAVNERDRATDAALTTLSTVFDPLLTAQPTTACAADPACMAARIAFSQLDHATGGRTLQALRGVDELAGASPEVMSRLGRALPELRSTLGTLEGLLAQLDDRSPEQVRADLARLDSGVARLSSGLGQLAEGLRQAKVGTDTTVALTAQLTDGLRRASSYLTTMAAATFILMVLLRSILAPVLLVATVILSFTSAVGVSTLIWQHLIGIDLDWSVIPVSFMAVIAVGADYSMLFASRIREESAQNGMVRGIIRGFGSTGGVITTAGVVFAVTMFALMSGTVLNLVQIGFTVGVGLLLDIAIVRTVLVPAAMAVIGDRIWWPSRIIARPIPAR